MNTSGHRGEEDRGSPLSPVPPLPPAPCHAPRELPSCLQLKLGAAFRSTRPTALSSAQALCPWSLRERSRPPATRRPRP